MIAGAKITIIIIIKSVERRWRRCKWGETNQA